MTSRTTTPSDRATVTMSCWRMNWPFPPRKATLMYGLAVLGFRVTWTAMLYCGGTVTTGPGGTVAVGVGGAVVTVVVGIGVTPPPGGRVQPAARARAMRRIPAEAAFPDIMRWEGGQGI
jgi:hypothetical protein